MSYKIEFAESVKLQLLRLSARQRTIVLRAIEEQLSLEPLTATRNRKLMRPNPLAPWELRVENVRVFYEVNPDEPQIVHVLAIGEKRGNRLFISGLEVKL